MLAFPLEHKVGQGVGTIADNPQRAIERALRMQEHHRHTLEGRWYDNILFTYGYQGSRGRYDLAHKRPIYGPANSSGKHRRTSYNITLRIVQDLIAALTQNPPNLKSLPAKREWSARQAARAGQDVLDGAQKLLDLPKLREQLAYYLGPTGNAFGHVGWDYAAGRKIPAVGPEGDPILLSEGSMIARVIAPFNGYVHPQAMTIDDSPWFGWRLTVARSWLKRIFRDKWEEIDAAPSIGDQDQLWDASLLNFVPGSGPTQTVMAGNSTIDHDEAFVELFCWYWRPTPEAERGRLVYGLGTKSQISHVLKDGINPYTYFDDGEWKGGIPFVHFKVIPIPGVFWGANIVDQVRDGQNEINVRQTQASALASATACSPLLVPNKFDSLSQKMTNEPGRIFKGPDNMPWMPFYPRPPEIPSYAIKMTDDAMGLMNEIAAPFGPKNDLQGSSSSGLHAAQLIEQMQKRMSPMIQSWELSWEKVGELILRNFQSFQKIDKAIPVKGGDGNWRKPKLIGADLDEDIMVEVEQGSAMPTSVVGTASLWIEFFKVGAANPNDPMTARRFWNDVRWGDMADSFPDATADFDKAQRNLGRALSGTITAPAPWDNPQVHLSVYDSYMKSEEWEGLHPQLRQSVFGLWRTYNDFQQMQLMAQLRVQQAAQNDAREGGGGGSSNPVQASAAAIKPGSPQGGPGPTASQGYGSTSENMSNPGGNPG